MKQMIQNHRDLLNLTGFNQDQDVNETAQLSAYANKTFFQQRPFSVVIEHKDNLHQQLVEVTEVKSRLAQNRIRVPIKKLMSSLVTPQIERY